MSGTSTLHTPTKVPSRIGLRRDAKAVAVNSGDQLLIATTSYVADTNKKLEDQRIKIESLEITVKSLSRQLEQMSLHAEALSIEKEETKEMVCELEKELLEYRMGESNQALDSAIVNKLGEYHFGPKAAQEMEDENNL